jgi:hypothetical protein
MDPRLNAFAMAQLMPVPGERRLYRLEGVGTLRLSGWGSHAATAEAHGLSWEITHRGRWHPVTQAVDAAGVVVGEFRGRTLQGGGVLRWFDLDIVVRPQVLRPERYVLIEDERTFATVEGRGWGRRPVWVAVDEDVVIHPGLLLFAVFVVGTLAQEADAAATAA